MAITISPHKFHLKYVLVLVFLLSVALMTAYTPRTQEEVEFGVANWEYLSGETEKIAWKDIIDDISLDYIVNNGRLSDKASIIVDCIVPGWAFSILNAIVTLLILIGIKRLLSVAGYKAPDGIEMFILMLFLVSFPWHESIFVVSYSLGYLWGAFLTLWSTIILFNVTTLHHSKIITRRITKLCCAILLFICGMWQEITAVSLLAIVITLIFFGTRNARTLYIIYLGCTISGFITTWLTEGQQTRFLTTDISINYTYFFGYGIMRLVPKPAVFLFFTYILSFSLCCFTIYRKQNYNSSTKFFSANLSSKHLLLHLICINTGLASLCLYAFYGKPRIMATACVFSVIGLAALIIPLIKNQKQNKVLYLVTLIITLVLEINFLTSTRIQHRLYVSHQNIMKLWSQSEDGVVFYNLPKIRSEKDYSWQMIITDTYSAAWKQYALSHFSRPLDEPKPIIVIPSFLKNIPFESYIPIDESNGFYYYKDALIFTNPHQYNLSPNIESVSRCFSSMKLDVILDNNTHDTLYCTLFPFHDSNGRELFYVDPLLFKSNFGHRIQSILSIHITPPNNNISIPTTWFNNL